jgi:hypothetical protein
MKASRWLWAVQHSIQLSLSLAGSAALALTSLPFAISPAVAEPTKVAQGKAAELGVMSVSLKDAVKLNYGLQGQLQGAGTPNEADAVIPALPLQRLPMAGPKPANALQRQAPLPRRQLQRWGAVATCFQWRPEGVIAGEDAYRGSPFRPGCRQLG